MKPFIPYKEELDHILTLEKGQTFVIARPVEPQPPCEYRYLNPGINRWWWVDGPVDVDDLNHWPDYYEPILSPFGKEGEEFFVQEECYLWRMQSGELVLPDGGDGPDAPVYMDDPEIEIIKKNDQHLKFNHELFGWKQVSASAMPQWASRRTIRNAGTECKRVQDLTIEEQKKLGCLEPNNFMAPLHQEQWQSRFGDQYSWQGNPWAFLTTMEVR